MISRDSLNQLPGFDQIAEQIGNLFGQSQISADIKRNLGAVLQAALARADVVTREDFDAQAAILQRTRAKLDQLESQLAELSRQLDPPR
jgi:BMFP domain-containing protein YqiC